MSAVDAIHTQDLTKAYRTHLGRKAKPSLDGVNLAVREGEVYGFLGKNGAGKTTTIKILCGLIRQTQGAAKIFGIDSRQRAARKRLGYLPENPYFYEYLTPRETLDFYGRLEGMTLVERDREWGNLSEMLDLKDIADQRVRGFSKGMRQRLGFAVALAGNPDLLILDEPMSGLDPLGRRMIRELILRLRDMGKTVFFSSHVLGDVEQICDRVGIVRAGKLTVQGRIQELLTKQIRQVEVIAGNVSDAQAAEFAGAAQPHRVSEDGHHFIAADMAEANALARKILDAGGEIRELTPIKETLEDYFMREQDTPATSEG